MKDKVSLVLDTDLLTYPQIKVSYTGTKVFKFYKDEYLRNIILNAINEVDLSLDMYDITSCLYNSINQAVKRRYSGQELELMSVVLTDISRSRFLKIGE